MSVELTDDQYLDLLLQARQPAKKRGSLGCGGVIYVALALAMIAAFAVLTADRLGYVPPSVMGPYVGTSQVQFRTQPTGAPKQPPPALPMGGGAGAPAWPTLTPEGATATPTPAPTAFWTPAEQTQIAATATAFIEDVPTAPPAFAAYVDERCKDQGAVEESATLQLFCKK